MPIGEPTMPTGGQKLTNEERTRIAELEKSRKLFEEELLNGGAEYVTGNDGEQALRLSDEQMERMMLVNKLEYEYRRAVDESRKRSDEELLRGGAEYVMDENGGKLLMVGENQVKEIKKNTLKNFAN